MRFFCEYEQDGASSVQTSISGRQCEDRLHRFVGFWQALPEGADGSGSKRKWYDDQKKKRAEELKRLGLEPDQVARPVPALILALTSAFDSAVHGSCTALEMQTKGIRRGGQANGLKLNYTFDMPEALFWPAWCSRGGETCAAAAVAATLLACMNGFIGGRGRILGQHASQPCPAPPCACSGTLKRVLKTGFSAIYGS